MISENQYFDDSLPFILDTIGETPKEHLIIRDPGPAFNQFIWIKDGVGKFEIAGNSHILHAGEGMFMRSGVAHRYQPRGDVFHTMWCTFFVSPNFLKYCIGDSPYLIFKVPDFLERETEMLTVLAKGTASTLELSAAGYTYVINLFNAITKDVDDIIVKVRHYLEENCHRVITLEEISAVCELDKFALCRYFRKNAGISVMDELKKIRIKKAKRLLRYSSDSIEAVGKACGYDDASYFGLKFREECGCTPLQYRKSRR